MSVQTTTVFDGHGPAGRRLTRNRDRAYATHEKRAMFPIVMDTGLEIDEIAQVLGVSPGTVKRDWRLARLWLNRQLAAGPSTQPNSNSCAGRSHRGSRRRVRPGHADYADDAVLVEDRRRR